METSSGLLISSRKEVTPEPSWQQPVQDRDIKNINIKIAINMFRFFKTKVIPPII